MNRDGDHLSSPDVAIRLKRPTRGRTGLLYPPIWSCSGWGFHGQPVTRLPVSSYLAISPLPRLTGAVCFCCTFRGVTPPGRYPASCPEELGLSSPINRGGHPVYLAQLYSIIDRGNSQTKHFVITMTPQEDGVISTGFYNTATKYIRERLLRPGERDSQRQFYYCHAEFVVVERSIRGGGY